MSDIVNHKITVENDCSDADIRLLIRNLVLYNDSQAEKENWRKLTIFVRNSQGEVIGGLNGYTHWNWLFISHLWISQVIRNQGYGRELVIRAEQEAINRGCRHAYLDTFDFQACGFYEKLGYQVFGALQNFPENHTRYFLQKRNIGSRTPRKLNSDLET
ncbi:GNAT family N-acetyltransferase [Microcoleus sp. FACHB-SPT15]|uniref:GNAT family N-acetyltransferase n=1 Tax=Microcoleus sp. FACHB-SPT15 TaxID=2692830 RepID=UPI0017817F61|nr:GNAT family N-acetyltransferase [Microcoleus sp. FACHB-SPT15]MBD1807281.1 GNAT family N-acetyltransferase [Microcoleus sp. FACHB-SPT15]